MLFKHAQRTFFKNNMAHLFPGVSTFLFISRVKFDEKCLALTFSQKFLAALFLKMELLETVLLQDLSSRWIFRLKPKFSPFFLFTVFPNFYFSPSTASITFCFKTFIYDSGEKKLTPSFRPSLSLSPFLSHSLPFSLTISAALRLLQLGSNRYLDQNENPRLN